MVVFIAFLSRAVIHIQISWRKASRVLGTSWERLWSRQGLGVGFAGEGDGVNAEVVLGKTARKKEGRGFRGKTVGVSAGITVLEGMGMAVLSRDACRG